MSTCFFVEEIIEAVSCSKKVAKNERLSEYLN